MLGCVFVDAASGFTQLLKTAAIVLNANSYRTMQFGLTVIPPVQFFIG